MPHQPIGVFDSGLGGLTVLQSLRARLPDEDFIYFADTRHLPYGDKPETFIQTRGQRIAAALAKCGCKAIVVACNTATAAAAENIRAQLALPVIALEPAIKPAAALTRNGILGVLATTRTLTSRRFAQLVKSHAPNAKVITQACPGLAEAIEAEGPESVAVETLLDTCVRPLADARADVVVLGCTHYPWVRAGIAQRLSPTTTLVDTGEAVARQVERRLTQESRLGGHGRLRFATSGDPLQVGATLARLCAISMPVESWTV
ncbi:MAG: glutamate racemase [Zoogloeaceae bacterium]|jgi:glutamate racemase|nr:glutamate racemase [Zoogloeaceae bacterium]